MADGTVVYVSQQANFPGQAVIIQHELPTGGSSYSVYVHLNVPSVTSGATVVKGQQIATVYSQNYSGRYPEFYTNNDDSHLHFEIRPFQDARTIFSQCQGAGEVGVGYAYPSSTISNWNDPLAYIATRVATISKAYLPALSNFTADPTCTEGQSLASNIDFEDGFLWDPNPWIPVATTYTGPQSSPYLVNDAPTWGNGILSGTVAELGALSYARITDEELTQSFVVPPGTTVLTNTWVTYLLVANASVVHWRYRLTYFNAVTGEELIPESNGCAHDNTWVYRNMFVSMSCTTSRADNWGGRKVRVAFVGLGDGVDGATLYVDHLRVRTHCGATQSVSYSPAQVNQTESTAPLP